jgi:hypothetical protein
MEWLLLNLIFCILCGGKNGGRIGLKLLNFEEIGILYHGKIDN